MAKNIIELLDELEAGVRDAFLASIRDIKSEAQIAMLVARYEAGDIEGFLRVLNLKPEFFTPLDEALRAAYLQGGTEALAGLPLARLRDPFPVGAWSRGLKAAIHAPKTGSKSNHPT